jgi:hypothetical protein
MATTENTITFEKLNATETKRLSRHKVTEENPQMKAIAAAFSTLLKGESLRVTIPKSGVKHPGLKFRRDLQDSLDELYPETPFGFKVKPLSATCLLVKML